MSAGLILCALKRSLTSMCSAPLKSLVNEQKRTNNKNERKKNTHTSSIVCVFTVSEIDIKKMHASLVCFHLYFLSHHVCVFVYLLPVDAHGHTIFFLYFTVQLFFYYVYSFYINLSFNDVNDFIFRFSLVLCWILISWYFLHAQFFFLFFSLFFLLSSSCFRLFRFGFSFNSFYLSSFSSLHNTWFVGIFFSL